MFNSITHKISLLKLSDISYQKYVDNASSQILDMINNSDLTDSTKKTLRRSLETKQTYLKNRALRFFLEDYEVTDFSDNKALIVSNKRYRILPAKLDNKEAREKIVENMKQDLKSNKPRFKPTKKEVTNFIEHKKILVTSNNNKD